MTLFEFFQTSSKMEGFLLASKIVSMLILGLATWIIGLVPMVAVRRDELTKETQELMVFVHFDISMCDVPPF